MKILVTGAAGFIGFHLTKRLLKDDNEIIGLDNINSYYDVDLKYGRLNENGIKATDISYNEFAYSSKYTNYKFIKLDLEDKNNIELLFENEEFDYVCNMAAQAGVRYSLNEPHAYINSNILGFLNILEASRHHNIKHLVYASSSSVYGLNEKIPFSPKDNVDHPASLYAATKKSNELMAHAYSHLYNLPTTGLRFFTVYGPWGRPDMAYFKFTKSILNKEEIHVYNHGNMKRDFTYIDDVINVIEKVIKKIPIRNEKWSGITSDPSCSSAPYKIYNIGNNNPVRLLDFIEIIEKILEIKSEKILLPLQKGDVITTFANVDELDKDFAFVPTTSIYNGLKEFINWYRDYYQTLK